MRTKISEPTQNFVHGTVELGREYAPTSLDEVGKEETETRRQIARYLGKDEDHSLLAHTKPLVVVFGEARSGKTTEFRRTAKNLLNERKHAFFIRLE